MELENLKNAWEELNCRITRNELTNQRILTEMIIQRKESVAQYFSRWKKASIISTILVWIIVPVVIFTRNIPFGLSVLLLILMLVATAITFVGYKKWSKIQQWENLNIEKHIQRILEYKIFTKISYIVVYILVLPVVIYAYYQFTHLWGVLTAIILAAIVGDCFVYHTTSDRLKEFSNAISELEELKQMQK